MLEWLEIVRNAPSRTASATAYRLANESYPNVAQTTLFCAQAAWRSYGRALREGDPDDQEALLNEALSLFRRTVEQNPSRAGQVYERLWSTDRNVAWLRAVTPDYIPCHEQLYRFLFSRRHLEEAVVELQLISDLNQAREDEGVAVWEEDRFDLARRDRRTRSEVGISVQKREILLMGLLSRWEERRERLDGFRARLAEQLGDQLASGKALLEQGEAHRARVQLDRVLVIEPFHADAVVTQARIERELGQDFDALQLLLRLVYHEQELPPEVVTQALELLQELRPNNSGIRGVTNLPPFPADRFLSTALRFRAGVEPVTELRDEFSELVDLVEKREVSIWVQMPLLDVYLGDAQARSGDTQAAVRSYAAALERCPTHLTAAQRLLAAAAADSDSVPAAVLSQARRLVQRAQPDTHMQVAFGDKAQLLGYTVTPREIPVVGAVEVTFHWLCTGDINRDYTISCAYYLGDDLVFTDSYKPGALGSDMPTWRVGEVISIRRQVAPTTLAARQRRGRLSPGSYDLRVSLYASGIEVRRLEPLVECRGPAFTIRR
jgi:tetratricopeptide (TPR) repeat protein